MSNKNINQIFEALTPSAEQKEKTLHSILLKGPDEHSFEQKGQRKFPPVKLVRHALLAAVLMVCLTTTAFAAAYMGLDEAFIKFLKPADNDQALYLSNGAYAVDQTIDNEYGSLTIKQVIGDSNLTYILMDFTAPEGTVLNAARYRFLSMTTTNQSYHSTGFEVLGDGDPNDNKLSLVMNIMTENSLAGQTIDFNLYDLQAADPLPGIFETVIPGSWKTSFKLDFKEYSTLYQINQGITMYGYEAILKTISVSPISITLKIDSGSLKEINKAAGRSEEIALNVYLDDFPVTINYKDGTSETTSIFTGLATSDYLSNQMLTIKTFDNLINEKEIVSFKFFGKVFPVNN
ncbi:hypothetical protein [Paenibacillus borealis]|uniref:DUF4179 domain-containing protein n=1 Tax=Paenibacillus borealis TaxID=160799 RepID=A0A089LEI1_PAEBO|nr:hypothetical protein [Paenibacillus borealis]AIQ59881.1 hypothetical protein PBOR_25190 [Paenibacillus borealis]